MLGFLIAVVVCGLGAACIGFARVVESIRHMDEDGRALWPDGDPGWRNAV